MLEEKYPKTKAAIEFMAAFDEIKMIATVQGIIDMYVEDISNEALISFDESGAVKDLLSVSDVIKMSDSSVQKEWQSFILRNVRTHLNQMTEELTGWIKVEGEKTCKLIMKQQEDQYATLQKKLTKTAITSRVITYNKQLQESKIKIGPDLKLDPDLTKYMELVNNMLDIFNYQNSKLVKQYKKRINELERDGRLQSQQKEFVVDHRLRWNADVEALEDGFKELIEQGAIGLVSGEDNPEKIMSILKMVFEEIKPPKSRMDVNTSNGKIKMDKKPFVIPELLIWKADRDGFKSAISPLVKNPKSIFIEVFANKERGGEIRRIAKILQQFMIMPSGADGGVWKESVVENYLNDPQEGGLIFKRKQY